MNVPNIALGRIKTAFVFGHSIKLIFDSIAISSNFTEQMCPICVTMRRFMFTELSKITGCKSQASFKQRRPTTCKEVHGINISKPKNMYIYILSKHIFFFYKSNV